MKILIIDAEQTGLPFAMRCDAAGHVVRYWVRTTKAGNRNPIGDGMVPKILNWLPSMRWADLIVMTDNTKYAAEFRPYFVKGFPIFGTNQESAELELDRMVGQQVLEEAGIETLPYEPFKNYDDAVAFAKAERKEYVSKPWGGASDKNLSYVPDTRADLVCRLLRWKKEKLKGDFILQEKIDGLEMGVGAWFGPGGFGPIEENWEHKKLMVGNLGPTTGEMGTIMRYTKTSKLFEEVLRPLEDELKRRKFVGSVDINCMIDKKTGKPWPLEFTCRLGWPAFNLSMWMHKGDPANWMLDLLEGRNTLKVKSGMCAGVVMATGDFPFDRDKEGHNDDWPIRGLDDETLPHCFLTSVKRGQDWVQKGEKVVIDQVYTTAGQYVLVVCGDGETIQEAKADCMEVAEEIKWPPHQTYRTDIGDRLEEHLPLLQEFGYATGVTF